MMCAESTPRRSRLVKAVVCWLLCAVAIPAAFGFSQYGLDLALVGMAYGMIVLAWDVFCGATEEVSFGHSFFVGVAAYATALVQSWLGLSPLASIIVGACSGMAAGLMVGAVTARHTGPIFAMVTMAVQLSFHRGLFIWSGVFGGEEGVPVSRALSESPTGEYVWVACASGAALLFGVFLRDTGFGRQLRAAGGDTRVGLASGVPVPRVRIAGLALSGLFAGMGGSLLAMHNRMANQELAGDSLAVLVFLLGMAGGMGSLLGPWLAGVLYYCVVKESLSFLGSAEPMVVAGLLLLVIWAAPDGLASLFKRSTRNARGAEATRRGGR